MKIIYRQYIKEFIKTSTVIVILFTIFFLTNHIFRVIELLIEKRAPFTYTAALFVSLIPAILGITIPMGILGGTTAVWGRMEEDREILALKTCRINTTKLFVVNMLLGFFASVFLLVFIDRVIPVSNMNFKKIFANILTLNPVPQLEEKRFVHAGNITIYVDKIRRRKLEGIIIHEQGEIEKWITAKWGKWDPKTRSLILYNGREQYSTPDDPKRYRVLEFEVIKKKIWTEKKHFVIGKGPREMTLAELRKRIKSMKKRGIKTNYFEAEYHKKIAIAFACLVLSVLGMNLGILIKRGGIGLAIAITTVVVMIYYILLTIGENLAKTGRLNPAFSMWLGDILLFTIATALSLHTLSEGRLLENYCSSLKKILNRSRSSLASFFKARFSS